jgi:hypothetical protein
MTEQAAHMFSAVIMINHQTSLTPAHFADGAFVVLLVFQLA